MLVALVGSDWSLPLTSTSIRLPLRSLPACSLRRRWCGCAEAHYIAVGSCARRGRRSRTLVHGARRSPTSWRERQLVTTCSSACACHGGRACRSGACSSCERVPNSFRRRAPRGVSRADTRLCTTVGDEHIARERTFFGVYRIVEADGVRSFYHGTTLHGAERRHADGTVDSRITYYGPGTPYAELLSRLTKRPDPLVLGIAGLGTGSLACFARPGDAVRIYEIDPAVVRLAREYFAALPACAPDAFIGVGDARLLIAREETTVDFLALDAFTSDAIPVHLLTEEAFRTYINVLAPEGIIAVHISNRHIDLEPVVAAIAARTGLVGRIKRYSASEEQTESMASASSHLVVLARDEATLGALALDAGWVPLGSPDRVRVWTDDYASIVPLLRWW